MDRNQLLQRSNEVFHTVAAISMDKAAGAGPRVTNACDHLGAAEFALELIANAEDPDRRRVLAELFAAPKDVLDWTAFSLGTHSILAALDLCAAAAWRLSDGKPPKDDKEVTLSYAFQSVTQLMSGPLRDWTERVGKSRKYKEIRESRHAFTHRHVPRHVNLVFGLGEDHRTFASEVGGCRQATAPFLGMAVPFGVEQFLAFCDAAIQQFKR